jgi:hypothetical protein
VTATCPHCGRSIGTYKDAYHNWRLRWHARDIVVRGEKVIRGAYVRGERCPGSSQPIPVPKLSETK